jgi:putative DNA primase/helicase
MQQSVQLDSGIIKKLVSGESISAKSVYKQPIEFVPYARLLIATNELPYLKTIDDSIRRRFIFLHLKQSFYGRENPNLKNEILTEKNDILVRAIKGGLGRLLQRDHFCIPEELEHELNNFIRENDTIELFLEDGDVERNENEKIHNRDLYPRYKMYCGDS